jgi:hypothetical protein
MASFLYFIEMVISAAIIVVVVMVGCFAVFLTG